MTCVVAMRCDVGLSGQVLQGSDCGRSSGQRPACGQCPACMLVSSVQISVKVMDFVLKDDVG